MTSFVHTLPRRRRVAAFAATTALASLTATAALAQTTAVERNLPPPVVSRGGLQLGNDNFAGSNDATPLGVNLVGVHVLGPKEKPRGLPGIVIGNIGPMPHEQVATAIAPFIGQPISRKLISDVQASIARVYREAGYPFVSVTLPPHNASRGLLQIRVVEFRAGKLKIEGVANVTEDRLASQVRLTPGDRIQAARLEEDLDWINRNPYRTVQGVFAPGDVIGASDLTLKVSESKPWQVFAGYSNTGQQATGYDRYYVGAGAVIAPLNNTVVSYQLTGSSDFWGDRGFDDDGGPNAARYQSQSARITIPTWSRQALEIAPNYVQTRQDQDAFITFNNKIFELPVIYRSAISNILPGVYLGDVYGGVELKHVERTTFFTGFQIGQGSADLFQLVFGWAHHFSDAWGHTAFDVRLKTNPGDVLGGNNDLAWQLFSSGRVASVQYTYGAIDANRVTTLPGGFNWVTQVSALISDQALPDTEQMALGGLYGVRGYTLDDGAVDQGFFWRNELRTPVIPLAGLPVASEISPYAFADYGQGKNFNIPLPRTEMASLGLGADFRFGSFVSATVIGAYALRAAREGLPATQAGTREGAWTVQGRVLVSY
jgi:hemolysin activation/secretion protein